MTEQTKAKTVTAKSLITNNSTLAEVEAVLKTIADNEKETFLSELWKSYHNLCVKGV